MELCRMDSDGDGLTNGQELGDPCCQWSPFDLPSRYMQAFTASHPGDASAKQEDGYTAPSCEDSGSLADTAPSAEHPVEGGFNDSEEQRSIEFIIKNYILPKVRTTYVDFIFNFNDTTHDIFHLIYGEPVIVLPKHLHHFVITACSEHVPQELDGVALTQNQSDKYPCQMGVGGFAGWSPGSKMWNQPKNSGIPIGFGAGVKAFKINTHFTDAEQEQYADTDIVSTDGIILHYTPDLRNKSVVNGIVVAVFNADHDIISLPGGRPRHFLTRECVVEEGCADRDDTVAGFGVGNCSAVSAAGQCDSQLGDLCPKTCKGCEALLPLHLRSIFYHAHLLGTAMTMQLKKKGTDQFIDLSSQDVWFYDDQAQFDVDLRNITLEVGDILQTSCEYNTMGRNTTYYDVETYDEMCLNTVSMMVDVGDYVPLWGPFICEAGPHMWDGELAEGEDLREVTSTHPVADADVVYDSDIAQRQFIARDSRVVDGEVAGEVAGEGGDDEPMNAYARDGEFSGASHAGVGVVALTLTFVCGFF